MMVLQFDNTYARLPERFYKRIVPTPVAAPSLIKLNVALAKELRLGSTELSPEALAEIFSGNRIPQGAEPVAMAYAGHQFANFVPQLGDGRAVLIGEVVDTGNIRRDIQLKGSGPTPFSRGNDGRAPVGPVLREYIVSEAMHALGIPTTRSLAAVETGEKVYRQTALPGAVLTRVAKSHIRVGTFEYFAARHDYDGIKILADYVLERLYPELTEAEEPYLTLLQTVIEAQAHLIASWMHVGFIHGVMNTDNMAISGETIDYGPCAFMDSYDQGAVFSSIDRAGRYAYGNQPNIALWNLARLAETLIPLLDEHENKAIQKAEDALNGFASCFESTWLSGLRRKLGLMSIKEGDKELMSSLLNIMQYKNADFNLSFRALNYAVKDQQPDAIHELLGYEEQTLAWVKQWHDRISSENEISPSERLLVMRKANPAYISRNHRIENAINLAIDGDYSEFERLLTILSNPFDEQLEFQDYMLPPRTDERVVQTFCGT